MTRHAKAAMGFGLAMIVLALAMPALADRHEGHGKNRGQAGQAGPTPEQRAKMATAHEQMAACLRTTRPIGDCHRDMRAAHEAACANGGCGKHHGGHHGGRDGEHGHGRDHDHHDDDGNTGAGANTSTTPSK